MQNAYYYSKALMLSSARSSSSIESFVQRVTSIIYEVKFIVVKSMVLKYSVVCATLGSNIWVSLKKSIGCKYLSYKVYMNPPFNSAKL